MTRQQSITTACLLSAVLLALSLSGAWGGAWAEDGSRYTVSLHSVSHIVHLQAGAKPERECNFLKGSGAVEMCVPAPSGDVAYSMLCAVFPLLAAGLVLSFFCGVMTLLSPRPPGNAAAALAGAALAAAFGGTTLAMIAMPRALLVLDGIGIELGAWSYNSAWLAVGSLSVATILAAASALRG